MESALLDYTAFSGGYALFVYAMAKQMGKSGWTIHDLVFALIVGGGIAFILGHSSMGNEGAALTLLMALAAGFFGERHGRQRAREKAEINRLRWEAETRKQPESGA